MQKSAIDIQVIGGMSEMGARLSVWTPSQSFAFDATRILMLSEGQYSGIRFKRVVGGLLM